ncbi:uncharacterized protein LOC116952094 isoform X1 [Petromyzon marinus]|uniref:uncharacterized protein LOC116952094 isoform X1 n=1 Tax=Petromyzon marinus TaxID=7757 RepID=UPI003F701F60
MTCCVPPPPPPPPSLTLPRQSPRGLRARHQHRRHHHHHRRHPPPQRSAEPRLKIAAARGAAAAFINRERERGGGSGGGVREGEGGREGRDPPPPSVVSSTQERAACDSESRVAHGGPRHFSARECGGSTRRVRSWTREQARRGSTRRRSGRGGGWSHTHGLGSTGGVRESGRGASVEERDLCWEALTASDLTGRAVQVALWREAVVPTPPPRQHRQCWREQQRPSPGSPRRLLGQVLLAYGTRVGPRVASRPRPRGSVSSLRRSLRAPGPATWTSAVSGPRLRARSPSPPPARLHVGGVWQPLPARRARGRPVASSRLRPAVRPWSIPSVTCPPHQLRRHSPSAPRGA